MNFEVQYVYTVRGIPKRCQKPRTQRCLAPEPYYGSIAETTLSAAPVALRTPIGRTGERVTLEYRWFDGRLWLSDNIRIPGPERPLDPVRLAEMAAHDDFVLGRTVLAKGEYASPEDRSIYREFIRSDHADVRLQLDEWCREHLIIDNVLYCQTTEPRYLAMSTWPVGDDKGCKYSVSVAFHGDPLNYAKHAYFRADELDEAIAAAHAFALKHNDPQTAILPSTIIEVLVPEAIQCQPPMRAAV